MRRAFPDIVALAVGAAIFFVFFGPAFLIGASPFLDAPFGDMAAEIGAYYHFAGDGWHFPLFVMPEVNAPEGSNILFTGGVPLLALLAKIAHSISGQVPDLFGAWYLLCCMLQTHSMYFLMRQISDDRPLALAVASVIGGLTYAFLSRIVHVSLFGHFFCIYAVGLVIATTNRQMRPRTILLALAGLVTASMFVFAYLAICNAIMFFAALASLWQHNKVRLIDAVKIAAVFLLVLVIVSYAGGYFWAVGKAAPAPLGGFQLHGLNLGALFSPPKSVLFPDRPFFRPWWEGDFYLGLGVMMLWLVLLLAVPRQIAGMVKRQWVIAAALGLIALYSLSSRISFLDIVLVDIQPPAVLTPLLGMARTAGRLFWPVGYLIVAAAIALTLATFRRAGLPLVAAAMVLTAVEATGSYGLIKTVTTTALARPLDYQVLHEAMDAHQSLRVYPSFWCHPTLTNDVTGAYKQIEFASGRAGLSSNTSVTARKIKDCDSEAKRALAETLRPGQLLMLMDRATLRNVVAADQREDFLRHCRPLPIGADQAVMCSPDLEISPDQDAGTLAQALEAPLAVNGQIGFAANGNRDLYVTSGWGSPESAFSWTDGAVSRLEFKLPAVPAGGLALEVVMFPYLHPPEIGSRQIEVSLNGAVQTTWTLAQADWQTRRIAIPADLSGRNVQLTLRQTDVRSPADLKQSADKRPIGLAIKTMTLLP